MHSLYVSDSHPLALCFRACRVCSRIGSIRFPPQTPQHAVIEFGARFGTTSCRIARATNSSGRVVAIEPDRRAIPNLLHNRRRGKARALISAASRMHSHLFTHRPRLRLPTSRTPSLLAAGCNFHVVNGTLGTVPINLWKESPYGYNQRTIPAWAVKELRAKDPKIALPPPPHNVLIEEVESLIGARVNAALIDCEGCIEFALNDTSLLERLELILLEEDLYKKDNPQWWERVIDYDVWHAKLRRAGFTQVWRSHDTFEPTAVGGWSRNMYHSAWQRKPVRADLCARYARKHGLPKSRLNCAALD